MKLSQFKYTLPQELIAQHPVEYRDECRLMVIHRDTGEIEHRIFTDFLEYVHEGDVVALNNSKVFPARLFGEKEKTGARIEVLLLRELDQESRLWDVLVDPARKIRIGNKLYFGENDELVAEVIDNTTSRGRTLRFLFDGPHDEFKRLLYSLGNVPIPKEQNREAEPCDVEDFQTVFAKEEGSVSAPFAGLHFSPMLLKQLELTDVETAELTLHISPNNFNQIEVADLQKVKSFLERVIIPQKTCDIINNAIDNKKKLFVVGTTTLKALETASTITNHVKPYDGWTDKFIFPPYDFSIGDALVTNFHLPESPMIMEAAAFCGYELLMHAYDIAVKERYRFFTYGDAMMII